MAEQRVTQVVIIILCKAEAVLTSHFNPAGYFISIKAHISFLRKLITLNSPGHTSVVTSMCVCLVIELS